MSDEDCLEDYGCGLMRRKKYWLFSEGDVNYVIDDFFHPLANIDIRYWFADGVAHFLNEQNPIRSLEKFVHYDVPHILDQVFKETSVRRRKRR